MGTSYLNVEISLRNQETLTSTELPGTSSEADRKIEISSGNVSTSLDDSTTTPAIYSGPVTMVETIDGTGTFDIDLTAAEIGVSRTEDFSTKKLVGFKYHADSGNSGNVTIAPGSSNGYYICGSSSGQITLVPGQVEAGIVSGVATGHQAVGASNKVITVTGTQDDVITIQLWFG